MSKLVSSPNLPENKVKKLIIGKCNTKEIAELNELSIDTVCIEGGNSLDSEIRSHADVLCFNTGKGELFVSPELNELNLTSDRFKVTQIKNSVRSPYPEDVPLNCAFIGDKIICNTKYVSDEIVSFAEKNKLTIIHTNQGYSKCSLCVVNKNAVITEDAGLYRLLKFYQFDVLKIESGQVYLSKNHSGFIGGASGLLSNKLIYFSGNIYSHKNYNNIKCFLDNYSINIYCNKSRQLRDFGGIIQLTEEN
ncbi:MAG: hypothetical protein E7533_00920 [Ruminococcaceae bacterium]|nr:hypothetical protein [Oscillospiraceae bacterium]